MSGESGGPNGGGDGSGGLDWQFLQCFGERTPGEEIQDADIISTVCFDYDGEHLATGDKGGRVVLFERIAATRTLSSMDNRVHPPHGRIHPYEYGYLTEFQSHEPEFDYLKSLEIEEKINKVRWCHGQSAGKMLISTNDKTVKLWKVFEKRVQHLADFNLPPDARAAGIAGPMRPGAAPTQLGPKSAQQLRLPRVVQVEPQLAAKCMRMYGNAHAYHINSIAPNADGETFVSADDLRVNLWHFEHTDKSFNIVDIKPDNMEDLTEVITAADFHPFHCHHLVYSSSKGCIRLADLRSSALCDRHAKDFVKEDPGQGSRSFFSEIISSVSDVKFSRCGRYLVSRDYMTVKLWDINKESAPVATFKVHEPLRAKLCDLYENDCIFDKFECTVSGDTRHVATGSYGSFFRVFGVSDGSEYLLESSRDPERKRALQAKSKHGAAGGRFGMRKKEPRKATDLESLTQGDFSSKMLHLAWHPSANVIACAAANSLYLLCTTNP